MSNKEYAISLLEDMSESQIAFVIGYIQGLKVHIIDEIEPDEWDLKMLAEAKKENDGETVSFDALLEKEGLTYADIQD